MVFQQNSRQNLFSITNIIIAITLFMYVVQTQIEYGTLKLGLNIFLLEYGLWYQPLSTIFAHGGIAHLLMNMFVLFQIGNLIEKFRGKYYLLALYFVGGVATSLLSFAFIYYFGLGHNLVGASGAICVLLGYMAFVDSHQRKAIVIWVLLISFAPLALGFPIAWYAHIIGFCIGFIMALIRP